MNNQQEEQEVNSNIEDNDPAYALAGSFGINTGENIVSAIVNNTVSKKTINSASIVSTNPSVDMWLNDNDTQMETSWKKETPTTKLVPEHYTYEEIKRLACEDLDVDLNTKKLVGIFKFCW